MADLPEDRLAAVPRFTYRAVDIELKRYAVPFTCLASRSVHIEAGVFPHNRFLSQCLSPLCIPTWIVAVG